MPVLRQVQSISRQLLGLEEVKWVDKLSPRTISKKMTIQMRIKVSSRLKKRVCPTLRNKNCFILNLQDGSIIRISDNLVLIFFQIFLPIVYFHIKSLELLLELIVSKSIWPHKRPRSRRTLLIRNYSDVYLPF